MKSKNALIVMTKAPVMGKCKTRLAKTIGDENALDIYIQLLDYTAQISKETGADKFIYSTARLKDKNRWKSNNTYFKLQSNGDLGNRMNTAIETVLDLGYKNAIVIGSDCAEINAEDIQFAFNLLKQKDIVIGPALDGGYYLIGMKKAAPSLFQNISWSTESVLKETMNKVENLNLSYEILEEKSDIDFENDLKRKGYVNFKIG